MKNTALPMLVASVAAPAFAQINPNFCAGVTAQNCGYLSQDGNQRQFDLSSLCLNDGTFYYDEDTAGHQYTTNVCGKLADECQVQQYCQTTSDTVGPTLPVDSPPICINDDNAQLEGMVKQYGFSQGCEDNLGNTSPLTPACSKCSMMAREVTAASLPNWGPIEENGVVQDLTKGIQVEMPVVPMSQNQAGHAWGACAFPQNGYQTRMIFECDCDQTSYQNADVFDANNELGVKLGKLGNLNADLKPDGSVADQYNCMYTLKFRHRDACYQGFCENGGAGGSDGLSGGKKFLIVACVFSALYLAAACFCGIKRNKETGETGDSAFCPTISLGTYAMYEFITTCGGGGGGSSSSIPGQDYSSHSKLSTNSASYKSSDLAQL